MRYACSLTKCFVIVHMRHMKQSQRNITLGLRRLAGVFSLKNEGFFLILPPRYDPSTTLKGEQSDGLHRIEGSREMTIREFRPSGGMADAGDLKSPAR